MLLLVGEYFLSIFQSKIPIFTQILAPDWHQKKVTTFEIVTS